MESRGSDTEGTYVYDLASDRFLRISDSVSRRGWDPKPSPRHLRWHTPTADGAEDGFTQWVGELID